MHGQHGVTKTGQENLPQSLKIVFDKLRSPSSCDLASKTEANGQTPFLDTLVITNSNKLEFDVYRKSTSTSHYNPIGSHYCPQHKNASFNFLYPPSDISLKQGRYQKKLKTIKVPELTILRSKDSVQPLIVHSVLLVHKVT